MTHRIIRVANNLYQQQKNGTSIGENLEIFELECNTVENADGRKRRDRRAELGVNRGGSGIAKPTDLLHALHRKTGREKKVFWPLVAFRYLRANVCAIV